MFMKKTLLLLLFAAIAFSTAMAQTPPVCKRDSSVIKDTTAIVSPLPYLSTNPVYRLNEACIGQPYRQYFTVEVPPTITLQGFTAGLVSASIPTTGGVTNLPGGLTYACDPPNCVFNVNTLGCIVLYGTPNAPVPTLPDTLDLKIKASVITNLGPFPFPIDIPGPAVPGNYFLIVKPAGSLCVVTGTDDLSTQIATMKNTPNPFSGQTMIEVEALESGDFRFEVFDLLGQRVHGNTVRLETGPNRFLFDAGKLPQGTYVYSLSNGIGRASKRMVVAQ